MTWSGRGLLGAIVVLALSGCGPADSSTTAAEPAADPPAATSSLPSSPPAEAPSPTGRIEPVDAADLAGSYPEGYVDLSAEAQQNFHAWVQYEAQTSVDSHGESVDITAGVSSCDWWSQGLEVTRVMELLQSEMGYDGTGAAAVLAGALRALCLQGDLGFRTTFDIDVEKFQNGLAMTDIRFDVAPTAFQHGFFMKAACQGMLDDAVGGPGIYDYMVASMAADTRMLQAGDQHALDVMINEAVTAGCYPTHDRLPPRIQQAS